MTRRRPRTSAAVEAVWAVADQTRRNYWILLCCSAATALVLGTGSELRSTAPAFQIIRATGGGDVWGALFGLAVVGLAVARFISARALLAALFCAGVLYMVWGLAFAEAALHSPDASWLGFVVQTTLALLHVSCALAYAPPKGCP